MKTTKRILSLFLVCALFASMLTACNGNVEPGNSQPNESASATPGLGPTVIDPSQQVVEGTSDETLTVALAAEPAVTDGIYGMGLQASVIAFSIYDGLIQWNSETGEFDPMLAESWEQLDECTIRFHLRKDAKFHDGEPFTTADVVWNFKNIRDNSAPASNYINNFDIDNFNVIDEYTIDIVTFKPYVLCMTALSLNYFLMLSPTTVESIGGEAHTRTPYGGSGAYKFVEWVAGSHILLERNEDYYGEQPYYKYLKIMFIVDDTARGLALESGDVDIAENVLENQALSYMADDNLNVYVPERTTAYALWYNFREGRPTANAALRQAIAYAIDTTQLPTILNMTISSSTADGIQPSSSSSYRAPANGYYEQDLEKAAALLAEAGYAPGELSLVLLHAEGGMYQTMAEYIQFALDQIGINVEIQSVAAPTATDRQNSGDFDMYLQRTGVYDPNTSGLQWFVSTSPVNREKYASEAFDAAADACAGIVDEEEYSQRLADAFDILREDLPAYYLIHTTNLFGMRNDLTGIYTEKMLCGIYTHVRPVA